ncbi:hypothetical protein D3C81_703170 [compost metagenome]
MRQDVAFVLRPTSRIEIQIHHHLAKVEQAQRPVAFHRPPGFMLANDFGHSSEIGLRCRLFVKQRKSQPKVSL